MLVYCFFLVLIFTVMFLDKLYSYRKISRIKLIDNEMIGSYEYEKKNYLLLIACIILFCISAFRFNVGWDYGAYYETIKYNLTTNIEGRDEYATIFLIELSRLTGIVNLFFFVNSFICIFVIYKTIKTYSMDPWLSLIFFICFPLFFLNSLSIIRFFTALALTFYGFKFIEGKKPIKYLCLILLASLFHKSAILAAVFYFARYIKLGTAKLVPILLLIPVLGSLINNLVIKYFPKYAVYTETTNIQEGTKAIIFFIMIAFLALILRKKITYNDEKATIYFNIFFMGIVIYLMFFTQGTMGHRLSLFGTIYVLLLVPKMISLFKQEIERVFLKFTFYVLLIVMFLYILNNGATTYIPYQTIFQ